MSKSTLKAPIFARITVNGKRAEISTGKSTQFENWIGAAGKVRGTNEESKTINNYLDKVRVKLTRIYDKMIDSEELVTAQEVKQRFFGKKRNEHSLIELFESHNDQMKNQIGNGYSSGTLERYETTFKHLKGFLAYTYKSNDIYAEDLKYSFITDFQYYLRTNKKLGHNTAIKYLRNFKKIVLMAYKNEWIIKDPFMKFKMSLEDVKKDYLVKEELQRIIERKFNILRLDQVRDVFIFCCYTGLAYADVKLLRPSDISIGIDGQNWIFIEREKTGIQSHIPLLPIAASIIEKYKDNIDCQERDRLLPVLSNQKINAYLKEIADLCNINKIMTFHMARHTFATTVTLANGVSIESVSSMLGHKNIRTTQIYAKVVKEKVSNEMLELKSKLLINEEKMSLTAGEVNI